MASHRSRTGKCQTKVVAQELPLSSSMMVMLKSSELHPAGKPFLFFGLAKCKKKHVHLPQPARTNLCHGQC